MLFYFPNHNWKVNYRYNKFAGTMESAWILDEGRDGNERYLWIFKKKARGDD